MKRDLICIKSILQVKRFKPPDVAQYLTLSTELERFARSLDNDAFVKRNMFALSSAIAGKKPEALGNNLVSLLKAAYKPNVLNHARKRRFIKWFKRTFKKVKKWGTKTFGGIKNVWNKVQNIWNKVKNWATNSFGGLKGLYKAFRNGFIVMFD